MDETLRVRLDELRADAHSGASELLPRAIDLLRAAQERGGDTLAEVARAVCAAQPSMAPLWNASVAALADTVQPGTLERFEQRARRAGAALKRVAVETLSGGGTSHFTTCSFSGSVLSALLALAQDTNLTVACAEGRPRYEGRRLAAALAGAGLRVSFYTDAAVGTVLADSDALLLGADAITGQWFLNKCGTMPLAAAASWMGVPVYILATRDKFLPPPLAGFPSMAPHDPAEVWDAAPTRVEVSNLYFERVPLDLVNGIVTDAGLIATDAVEEVCRANGVGLTDEVVERLRP